MSRLICTDLSYVGGLLDPALRGLLRSGGRGMLAFWLWATGCQWAEGIVRMGVVMYGLM